jgi:hypothetical protein
VVAYNSIILPFAKFVCIINGKQALKDWISKEADCSIRRSTDAYLPGLKFGFLGDNSRAGLAHRSIYTEFFFYDRVQRLREPMTKILDTKMKFSAKKYGLSKSEYTEIHVRNFLEKIVLNWISNLAFGCSNESDIEIDLDSPGWKELRNCKWDVCGDCDFKDYKRISLTKVANVIIETGISSFKELKNLLGADLPAHWGLTEKWRNYWKMVKLFDQEIMAFYNKRYQAYEYQELKEDESTNVIDLMVHHNKKCEASGNTKDVLQQNEIIGDILAFQFAGLDTSLQLSTTAVCKLARDHPEWIDKIRADGLDTLDQISNNKSMGLVIKEVLRLHSPVIFGFFRCVTKDTEVAGVPIPKGCVVIIPGNMNSHHPHWVNPTEFNPERF